MTSGLFSPRLKRRYMAATAGVSAAALLIAGALLYAHSAGVLTARGLGLALLVTLAVAGVSAVALIGALADRFVRPLRAVVASLQRSASGNYEAATDVGPSGELSELADAVNAMRISLRSSAISRDYLDRLLAGMGEALLITDAAGRIERANAAASELFGRSEAELVGKLADDLIVSSDRRRADGVASRPREGAVPRPDGTSVSISYTVAKVNSDRGDESKVYAAHNIDERKRVEQRIRYLARTDPLTKIANRMQFQHVLQQGIARARRTQQYVAILYLDLDRFKDINDTFGHAAGDTSLEIFARRVLAELPDNAHAGRLAGDEFAVLLTGYDRLETIMKQLNELAPRLLQVAGQAVPGPRRGDLPDLEHGARGLPARWRQRDRPASQRRRRAVSGQEGRRQLLRVLLHRHEHCRRRAVDAQEQAAPRVRARRAPRLLPAEVLD